MSRIFTAVLGLALLLIAPRVSADVISPFNITASAEILNTNTAVLPGTNPAAPGGPCPSVTNVPGCLVQIIGVGANNVADLPNADGSVGGDDALLLTTYIGVGMSPCAQLPGRFTDSLSALDGTKMYGRAFNARTLPAATHWGQSALFTVNGTTVMDVSTLGLKRTALPKGSNPNTTDSDGDGQTDFNELVANTNPLDPTDNLRITDLTTASSVNIPGRAGRQYTLQRKTDDLTGPVTWTAVDTTGPLTTDTNLVLTDPSPPATPKAFYRIKVTMP